MKNGTHRDSISFPKGYTAAIQRHDHGPWKHWMIVESNSADHSKKSYKIRVIKTGRVMIVNTRQIQQTLTMTEQYLREQMVKALGI